jgi:acetyltransferase-like isoleucine patch superfamily enzyme
MERDAEGRIVITDGMKSEDFYHEDIVYLGLPVGRLTYGFKRFKIAHIRGIRSIGRFCSIAPDACVAGVHHPLDWVSTHPFLYHVNRGMIPRRQPLPDEVNSRNDLVEIQNDVWIGERAIILRPCVLGHGCVVAAGSVVTKDVPPYAIVAGTPARVIRYRIPEHLIPGMLSTEWWNWDLEVIRGNHLAFYDPAGFVERFATK